MQRKGSEGVGERKGNRSTLAKLLTVERTSLKLCSAQETGHPGQLSCLSSAPGFCSSPCLCGPPPLLSVLFLELHSSLPLLYTALFSLAPTQQTCKLRPTQDSTKGLSLTKMEASLLFWRQLYIATFALFHIDR